MLAITCDKCRRRYTATDEELRVYMHEAEGKKYAQVLCPHCGKPTKVSADRIHQALRFSPAPVEGGAAPGAGATAGEAPAPEAKAVAEGDSSRAAPGDGTAAPQGPTEEVNPVE